MPSRALVALLSVVPLLVLACQEPARTSQAAAPELAPVGDRLPAVPPPLELEGSACEAAAELVRLPALEPGERPGLHNVYALSGQIVSGAEPDGEEALEQLAAMGIKTVLSVDGKTPDVETARKHGLRYVHVPIQYKGITDDELLTIARTFREAEGPFYVHCFHGKHRGPAAAAVGRVVLDGASREQAIAEMRQWAGTSPKYEGLYRTIASGFLPSAEQTAALDGELPETAPLEGMAAFMVQVSRPFDNLKNLSRNGWKPLDHHPDLDPVNEGSILAGLFRRAISAQDLAARPDDFRGWMDDSAARTEALLVALTATRSDDGEQTWAAVEQAYDAVASTCNACHQEYRNL